MQTDSDSAQFDLINQSGWLPVRLVILPSGCRSWNVKALRVTADVFHCILLMIKNRYSDSHFCCHSDWSARTKCCKQLLLWLHLDLSRPRLSLALSALFLLPPSPSLYLPSWRHQSDAQPLRIWSNKRIRFSAKKSFKKERVKKRKTERKKENPVRTQWRTGSHPGNLKERTFRSPGKGQQTGKGQRSSWRFISLSLVNEARKKEQEEEKKYRARD